MGLFKRNEEEIQTAPNEIEELYRQVEAADMPADVVVSVKKEIERIAKMGTTSAEYTIGINYIDFLTSLPWNRSSEDRLDLEAAKKILDSETLRSRRAEESNPGTLGRPDHADC